MVKLTGESGLIREHNSDFWHKKCPSTGLIHQSSPLVQSSDCRLPHLLSFTAYDQHFM